jgi:hypothetical protein
MPDPVKLLLEEKLEACPDGFAHYYQDNTDAVYDVVKLWRLSELLPTFNILADDFDQFLGRLTAWTNGAPADSILDGEHGERVREADISYPILVRFIDGKIFMVDGYHRMMRARLDGEPFIQARDVSAILKEARTE